MTQTRTTRLAAIEASLSDALEALAQEEPVIGLTLARDMAQGLYDYVTMVAHSDASAQTRVLAREHLLLFVGHGIKLLEMLDQEEPGDPVH